jgi:hypothetical protein
MLLVVCVWMWLWLEAGVVVAVLAVSARRSSCLWLPPGVGGRTGLGCAGDQAVWPAGDAIWTVILMDG